MPLITAQRVGAAIAHISRTIAADLKQPMSIARHSNPRLTTGRYASTRLHDLESVVSKVPKPAAATVEAAALRKSGTDSRAEPSAASVEAESDRWRLRLTSDEETDDAETGKEGTTNPLDNQGVRAVKDS